MTGAPARAVPQPAREAARPAARAAARRRPAAPVIPARALAGRTLTLAMGIMCYLACLALGALLAIDATVRAWTSGLAQELTVQIRPLGGGDVDAEVAKAAAILRATPGVSDIDVLDRRQAAGLLEPWLGSGRLVDELPIPRLVAVRTDPRRPPELAALAARLEAEVKGASLDTHRQWQSQLLRTAGALHAAGIGVLALIALAGIAVIVFASRAALEATREAVEVLHLVGAEDRFIAREVQRRFLKLGLEAGLAGACAAAATLALLWWYGLSTVGLDEAGRSVLLGHLPLAICMLLPLVPLAATLIGLVTVRFAVVGMLREVL